MHYPSTLYTPRSGAFRKVKYPLPLYDADEISVESKQEVIQIAKHLQEQEDTTQRRKLMCTNEPISRSSKKGSRKRKLLSTTKELRESSEHVFTNEKLSKQEVMDVEKTPPSLASVIDDSVYDKLYPQNVTLAPFPIVSCSDLTSSENEEPESEYDMDSEDDEWLNSNPHFNISPSRLEYVFTHLNRRNTHVKTTAMWALRPPYHEDFHKIFPYWKAKRLQNNNVSTWRLQKKIHNKDARAGGYIATDLVFQSKPQRQVKCAKKHYSNQDIGVMVDRALAFRRQMLHMRSWCHDQVISGEQARDHLVNAYSSIDERYNQIRSQTQESSSLVVSQDSALVDANNNEDASAAHQSVEMIPETPTMRKVFDKDSSILPSCSNLIQSILPFIPPESKPFQKEEKKQKELLAFEDILKGRWRTHAKNSGMKDIKENQPFSDLKCSNPYIRQHQGWKVMRSVIRNEDWNTTLI